MPPSTRRATIAPGPVGSVMSGFTSALAGTASESKVSSERAARIGFSKKTAQSRQPNADIIA